MSADELISEGQGGVVLRMLVQPKARRTEVVGVHADRLKVAVTAAPDRGAANAAVTELVAGVFRLPKSAVSVLRGTTSRRKDLLLSGIEFRSARAVLGQLLESKANP